MSRETVMDPWIDAEALLVLREIVRSPAGLTRAQIKDRVGPWVAYHATPRLEQLGHIKRQGGRWHAGEPLPDPRDVMA